MKNRFMLRVLPLTFLLVHAVSQAGMIARFPAQIKPTKALSPQFFQKSNRQAGELPPISFKDAQIAFAEVRNLSYPELASFMVTLELSPPSPDFLWANFRKSTVLRDAIHREYVVFLNPKLLADPPSIDALKSIFAHELSHIRDYSHMSGVKLLHFVADYVIEPIRNYERATDLVALQKGYGSGLIVYREWLYKHTSGEVLVGKMRDYYGPAEIKAWLIANPSSAEPSPSPAPSLPAIGSD